MTISGVPAPLASPRPVLLAVSLCSFMTAFDTTALNVTLPAIGHAFSLGLAGLQWVAGAYTLMFAGLLLSAGALSDRFGARRLFIVALLLFILSSVACGLAANSGQLIAFRAIQGMGAALMLPSSMALLTHAYPDRTARSRAVALWGGISALALVAGPLLGGAFTEALGWRAIFFLNVPLCAIALGGCLLCHGPDAQPHRRLDWPGQLLSFLALLSLTFVLIEGATLGWASPMSLGLLAMGLLLGTLFLKTQRRPAGAMLPLTLFSSRAFTATVAAGFLQTLGYYGSLFLLPMLLQARGDAPLTIGWHMLPMTLVTGLLATFSGRLSTRYGARRVGMTGMLGGALGALLLLSGLTPDMLVIGGVLLGMAGATLPVIVTACLASVPVERVGIGSGVLNAARQCGGLAGIALLGALLQMPHHAPLALICVALAFALAAALMQCRLQDARQPSLSGR